MANPDAKTIFRDVLPQLVGTDGDLGTMEDSLPMLTSLLEPVASPEFVCVMQPLPPTPPQTHAGIEGVAAAWKDYGDAFETVRARLEEVLESDDHVVLLVDQVATTRHGAVEISQPSAMLLEFGEGQLTRLEFHLDRELALRRAGLEP